jgi:DamX protein
MSNEKDELNYRTVFNLKADPFNPDPDLRFLFEYASLEQCFTMLKRLVEGTEIIILVIGEAGSGKTTLLKRYLSSSEASWKTCRIRIPPVAEAKQSSLDKDVDSYPAHIRQDVADPIIIIDDAHKLTQKQLKGLLQNAQSSSSARKVKRFVFFCEPSLNETVSTIAKTLADETAISKIFLPAMTREETVAYLNYRLALAGYVGRSLFRSSFIKQLHRSTGGLPGRINVMADQWLKKEYSIRKQLRRSFQSRIHRRRKIVAWATAGFAFIILSLVVLYRYQSTPELQPEVPKLAKTVIRKKIVIADHLEKTPPVIPEILSSEKIKGQPPPTLPPPKKPIEVAKTTEPQISSEPPVTAEPLVSSKPTVLSEPPVAPEPPELSEPIVSSKPPVEPETVVEKQKTEKKTAHREEWLLSQKSSHYTIQIMGVRNEKWLLRFIHENLPEQHHEIAYYQTSYKGKDWYPLLYGVYATKEDASTAMKELPKEIKKASPWIRQMSAVQKAIRKRSKQ